MAAAADTDAQVRAARTVRRRLARLPLWVTVVVLAVLLVFSWVISYAAGGSQTAWPHLFYVPIVLAALPFGIAGGAVAGLAAALLAGPALPLDVAAGQVQTTANWVTRGVFFVGIGVLAGTSVWSLERRLREQLRERVLTLLVPSENVQALPVQQVPFGDWDTALARALEGGVLRMVFQPVYSLANGRLVGVEALARFDTDPMLAPNLWFDAAARRGCGVELELAAVSAALQAAEQLPSLVLSFNASPRLLASPLLVELLDEYSECTGRLVAEVTEHAAVENYATLDAALDALRERGVRIAVDDAGAGFASLSHIVRLDPEVIKLDPALTRGVTDDVLRQAMGEALTSYAERTDSLIVVEGIEQAADLAVWQQLGAHAAQGFLLAHPGELPAPVVCEAITPRPARRSTR